MTVPATPPMNTPSTTPDTTRGQIVTASHHGRVADAHQRIANLHRALDRDPNDEILAEQVQMAEADLVSLTESLRTPPASQR